MRRLSARLAAAFEAIDAANSADPTSVEVRGGLEPLALAHGRLATLWVDRLSPDAGEAVQLAARAHHLRRWEVPRSSYPEGRAGYLRWRRDQKARHAADVEALLVAAGFDRDTVGRVQVLIRRESLADDAEAQVIEDVACLAFLETQLGAVARRLDPTLMTSVIVKTARKMSPAALALVGDVPLSGADRDLLLAALA